MTNFQGHGFDRDEFSPDERAQLREAHREYDRDFIYIRKVGNLVRSWRLLVTLGGGAAGLAYFVQFWVQSGGLP